MDIARSDPENYERECARYALEIQNDFNYNSDKFDETFTKGIEICNKASELFSSPIPVSLYGSLQRLYRQKAKYLTANKKDATEYLDKGIETLKSSLKEYPDNIVNYAEIIASFRTFAQYIIKQDKNPIQLYNQVLPYFEKGKKIDNTYPDIWYEMAVFQGILGDYYLDNKKYAEAQEKLEHAINNYKKSEKFGIVIQSIVNSSYSLASLSEIKFENEKLSEGLNLLQKALAESDKATKILNNYYMVYDNYLLMLNHYIDILKRNNMDYEKPLLKAKELLELTCRSDFIQGYQFGLLKEKIDLYIKIGVISQESVKTCLKIIENHKAK